MSFTRRAMLASAGAAAAIPSFITSAEAAPAFVAWHGRNGTQHKALLDENAAKGYRTSSLCIYGAPNDPRYASVMLKRPVVVAQEQIFGVNGAVVQQKFEEMAGKGWGPTIVTATGPVNSARFAAVFRPGAKFTEARPGLTKEQFDAKNEQALANGNILLWVDAYGTPQDTRYVAIWGPNLKSEAWNCEAIDEDLNSLQQRFDALASVWCRSGHIAVTPSGKYVGMFTDSRIGTWTARGNMTSAQYQAEFTTAKSKGMFPVRVAAKGTGPSTRYAAIFASRENTDPRVFRARGPAANAAIDGAMESFIKAHDMRGASLAITMGSKLVYARGYTWAEAAPIYPDVLPTTLFRQASVSKTFNAVALYRLMQQNPSITLDKTMQSVLGLKKPNGGNPSAAFNSVKLKHLIESTSGINQGLIWTVKLAVQEFGANLPATQEQLARYVSMFGLTGTPGNTANVVYGNLDYFLLSQVVTKLAGTATFEQALKQLVLDPLAMKRTRGSRTLVNAQLGDEARYHLRVYEKDRLYPLTVAPSLKTATQPLVPSQYGNVDYELIDGCGGLSSSAVDLARLVASFSAGNSNPVLSSASVVTMLTNAAIATATYSGPDAHGYHGFDGMLADIATSTFAGSKGGWLASHEGGISFFTGNVGFAVTYNGNKKAAVTADWAPAVLDTVLNTNWGSTDLFPSFGMPSFGGGPIVQLQPKFKAVLNPNAAIAKVRRATLRTLHFDPRRPLRQR